MYKLIIILILLVILFYMLRRAVQDWGAKDSVPAQPGKDVMIQDPVCKVYITAGSAVTERVGEQTYYFCSKDCAQSFKKDSSG